MACAVTFPNKRDLGRDHVVPPLKGDGWAADILALTMSGRREEWCWTPMLTLPGWIEAEHVAAARAATPDRDLSGVRLGGATTGLHRACVSRWLHLGPFAGEAPHLERLHHQLIPQGDESDFCSDRLGQTAPA